MASLAAHILAWAEQHGTTLTPEQIATIPAYQREIYAAELAEHERRHMTTALATSDLGTAAKAINLALRPSGWAVLEVAVNAESGFARVVAERRDEDGQGIKVMLLRGCHGADVLEQRDMIELRPGMFRAFWEVADGDGWARRRHADMPTAVRALAGYIDDNPASGALPAAAHEALGAIASAF